MTATQPVFLTPHNAANYVPTDADYCYDPAANDTPETNDLAALIADFEPSAEDWQDFAAWNAEQTAATQAFDDACGVTAAEIDELCRLAGCSDPFQGV